LAIRPLPSIGDIANVYATSTEEDAIIIAQSEITLLDDISLEGDIPDDVSDMAEDRGEKTYVI
jgi:hypothetical protein